MRMHGADLDSDEMPGTRKNPMMHGATVEQIDEARAAWAARDTLTQEQRNALAREPATRYATIGDDGTSPVVWGAGDSVDASHADALDNLRNVSATSASPLRTVPVSEERYQRIVVGDVDASDL